MQVITRFAPSPTGMLHIGGARTALFNYLFAKHQKGKFLLRIEDTDKARYTNKAQEAIIDGLTWLNLQWDNDIVLQSQHAKRHIEVAETLISKGRAYYCNDTSQNFEEKDIPIWKKSHNIPATTSRLADQSAIRFKVNKSGTTEINDIVQGKISIKNEPTL